MATKKKERGASTPARPKTRRAPTKRARKPAARKAAIKRPAAKKTAVKPAARKAAVKLATKKPAPTTHAPSTSIRVTVNGQVRDLQLGRDLQPSTTLAYLLRETLGFTGLKVACDEGACGGCTVLLDGRAVLSCMLLAVEADGHDVVTIEGLPKDDPVVAAFAEQHEPGYGTALQCGICTPGFVMATTALLRECPSPTLDEIKEGLSGNICRCGCYAGIARAVQHAAEKLAGRCACDEGGAR
jgi:aerobic carbon-monoxide dehydrogenase small subunit